VALMAGHRAYRVVVRSGREHIITAASPGAATEKAKGLYKGSQEPSVVEVRELMPDPEVKAEMAKIHDSQKVTVYLVDALDTTARPMNLPELGTVQIDLPMDLPIFARVLQALSEEFPNAYLKTEEK
jgi:hypothetical protein